MNSPEFVFNVGHSGWGLSVCYSPDRKYVVSEADEQTIKIWEIGNNPSNFSGLLKNPVETVKRFECVKYRIVILS